MGGYEADNPVLNYLKIILFLTKFINFYQAFELRLHFSQNYLKATGTFE